MHSENQLNHLLRNNFLLSLSIVDASFFHALHFVVMIIEDIGRHQSALVVSSQHVLQPLLVFVAQVTAPYLVILFQGLFGHALHGFLGILLNLGGFNRCFHSQEVVRVGVGDGLLYLLHEFLPLVIKILWLVPNHVFGFRII